jgi:adenosylhomocysteine nucleosidase
LGLPLGIVVGLKAEARMARPLPGRIAIGGGDRAGAQRAAECLIERGVSGLVSFGLAGGLDPALRPGALVIAGAVLCGGRRFACDPELRQALGGFTGSPTVFGGLNILAEAAAKARLFAGTGAACVDLESGAVASAAHRHNLPFAVLRAVCDPAERDLPPAALIALNASGAIGLGRVMRSVLRNPGQIAALLQLSNDAKQARSALVNHIRLCPISRNPNQQSPPAA